MSRPDDPWRPLRRAIAARGPRRAAVTLNLTAMIDVVFLLMTYFLLIAQFNPREEAFAAVMPPREETTPGETAAETFNLPERPIEVTVRSVGDGPEQYVLGVESPMLTAGGPITTFKELTQAARDQRGAMLGSDQDFVIHSAKDTRWEHALGAMAALRDAGFEQIRFGNDIP